MPAPQQSGEYQLAVTTLAPFLGEPGIRLGGFPGCQPWPDPNGVARTLPMHMKDRVRVSSASSTSRVLYRVDLDFRGFVGQ